jgi:cathepsin L
MSDWSDEEYRSILTYKPMPEEDKIFDDQPEDNGVSNGIDWRSSGAVNSIKNQGSCGSCWAFSTVAAMEAAHKIASGSLLNLSEQ